MNQSIKADKLYYKAFDENLRGMNNYQYEVGKTYIKEGLDTWIWLHYAEYVSSTLTYFSDCKKVRVCLVEPLGQIDKFPARNDGYGKGYYFTTNKIKIVRELTYEQIFSKLEEEKCTLEMILKYMNPPVDYLIKNNLNRRVKFSIYVLNRKDLTKQEKMNLLPKTKHKFIYED